MFALLRRSFFAALALVAAASAQDVDRSRGAIPENPPLMRWQRALADAEAARTASAQPLLICVNMDSEAASERLAHGRYTTAAFAELAQGFVAVIASPDRHTPKDYDEQGKRVPCPRFGCVTCGEHIAIEPVLFAKYFKENRVAPRHMGVGSDGNELFDIFLTNDFALIDAALKEHGKPRSDAPSPFDSRAREQEEAKYVTADRAGRAGLLEAAARAAHRPYDLVRLGLRDADAGLRGLARQALAATATPAAQSLLIALLDDEPDRQARAALVPVLRKVADDKPETALALRVHAAMTQSAKVLDSGKWLAALRVAEPEPTLPDEDLDARLDELGTKAAASDATAAVIVEFGATTLRFARERIAAGKDAQFLLSDAEHAADKALAKDGKNVRAHALRAELAQMLGQRDVAAKHARASLPALLAASEVATTQAGLVLAGLAEGGAQAIYAAEGKEAEWDGELLSEADAAYTVLATHPAGSAAQASAHADMLAFLGLHGCARHALTRALRRFGTDTALHERFRKHVIATRGAAALTHAYAELGVDASDVPSHQWFAGYAELVLAEHHKRQGDNQPASAAYGRSAEAFLRSQRDNPAYAESAAWYAAMAQAGRARVSLDLGDLAAAGRLIVEGIKRLPAVAEQEDGLGRTPLFTLKQILEQCAAKELVEVRGEIERELSTAVPGVWAKATGG